MELGLNSKIEVSVVIVNYNTFEITSNCLRSIYRETDKVCFEIILVDNASTECDPSTFLLEFGDLVLIKNDKNYGFGRANNIGMSIAKGKYILLLNSDTLFLNNVLFNAITYARSRPDVQIFGADIRNLDLSAQKSYYHKKEVSLKSAFRHAFLQENPIYFKLSLGSHKSHENDEIGGLYGAYIFMNIGVYRQTKGFDPDFFMYCEDTEWFRNRLNRIYKIEICNDAKVIHLGGRSSESDVVLSNKLATLSYYLYWYKLGKLKYWVYVVGSLMNSLFSIPLFILMSKEGRIRHFNRLKTRLLCLSKICWDIPRYSNRFGARPAPLKF